MDGCAGRTLQSSHSRRPLAWNKLEVGRAPRKNTMCMCAWTDAAWLLGLFSEAHDDVKKKITCCSCCCRHLLKACADGADFPLRYCVSTLVTRKTGKEWSKDNALSWSFYRMFVCRCKWWALSELLAKTLLSLLALYDTCFQTLPQVIKDYPISNGMPNYCSFHQWRHKILKKLLNML